MPIPLSRASDQLKYHFTTDSVASRPTSWEVSLHKGDPRLGNEVTTSDTANYARQSVSWLVTEEDEGGPEDRARATNDVDVTFPAAGPGSSFTVSWIAVRDASTGRMLAIGQLSPQIPVVENTIISFTVGDLVIKD